MASCWFDLILSYISRFFLVPLPWHSYLLLLLFVCTCSFFSAFVEVVCFILNHPRFVFEVCLVIVSCLLSLHTFFCQSLSLSMCFVCLVSFCCLVSFLLCIAAVSCSGVLILFVCLCGLTGCFLSCKHWVCFVSWADHVLVGCIEACMHVLPGSVLVFPLEGLQCVCSMC